MGLLDILASYKTVRDDIAAGEFLKAWEDTIPVQQGMIELGKSLGFKAGPKDAKTSAEIQTCAQECVDLCATTPKVAAAGPVGAFNWQALVANIVLALLDAWKNRTT